MSTDSGPLIQLEIDQIQANPLQPRGVITTETIQELVESIKVHGVLEPLVVAQTPAGYQLVAGERRWRAAKQAGLKTVPVVVKKTSPKGMLEMALVENVQRTDLNALDRAKAFERLMNEFNLSIKDISERISKSESYVSNTLRLVYLPDALKDGLLSGLISEGHARALLSIDNPRALIEAYKTILKESGSVRRAEELARRYRQEREKTTLIANIKSPKTLVVSELLDKMQEDLTKALGKKSHVSVKQSAREAKLTIVFKGNPDSTDPKLKRVYEALSDLDIDTNIS